MAPLQIADFYEFRDFLMFFGFFSKTVNGTYEWYTYFESADENTSFSYKIMIVYIKDQIEGSSLDLLIMIHNLWIALF